MFRLALAFVLCVFVSCQEPNVSPTMTTAVKPLSPDVVAWPNLVRDHQTASSYIGRTVRFRLLKHDYAYEEGVLKVWYNDRSVPPVLLIRLRSPLPNGVGALTVEGRCEDFCMDGTWRAPRINYVVLISDAVVTVLPSP